MATDGSDIMSYAKQFLGTPYKWGGNSLTGGVDCSGLVQQVYKHFGISVPRVTYQQIGQGKSISMNKLMPGDMVFFDTDKSSSGPDHVGLYLGDGKMLHAPHTGDVVKISDITTGYYQDIFMGGRRVSGISGGGLSSSVSGDTATATKLSPEELASEYGWAYSFLKHNDSVSGLFDQAVKGTWTAEKFQAKLRETKWWKENSDTMRQAQVLKETDPATYQANVAASKIQIQQMAAEMGAAIPSKKLNTIAASAYATGMDEASLKNTLGKYITFTKNGTLNGAAGMFAHSIKEYAASQGVKLDDQTVKNQAALIARGLATEQDFQSQVQEQAASMYPAYADQLKAGQTVSDVASPYIQQMASDLEIPSTSITPNDPLIKQALNGLDDKGKPVGIDATTFQTLIRNDPRWGKTAGAQNNVMKIGASVLKNMGVISG